MAIRTIGGCIRAYREARQWTQEELAARAGLTSTVLSAYERDQITNIPSKSIIALAEAFQIDPGDLYPKQARRGNLAKEREVSRA